MTGLDHISISELLRLSSLSSQLSRNNNFNTLSTRLINKLKNTIASLADGKSSKELVLKRFGLGLSAETSVVDLLSEEVNGTLSEVESILYLS